MKDEGIKEKILDSRNNEIWIEIDNKLVSIYQRINNENQAVHLNKIALDELRNKLKGVLLK